VLTRPMNKLARTRRDGPPPARDRRAFTLVEVLLVIAVLGLLVAVLLPCLARARDYARQTQCQRQLRAWGQAFALYAAENDNVYPHIDGLDRDNGPADRFGWVDVLPPLFGRKPWRDHPLYHRPGEGTIFQCPSARPAAGGYDYRPERDGYFSYAMNSCLELDGNCYRAAGDGGRAMPSFLHTDLIVSPPRVVLLFDQLLDPERGFGGAGRNRSAGKHCGSYPKDFAVRHARGGADVGGSILYCDYHVSWVRTVWKDDWPENMNCPPRDDPDWFPYPK